MNDILTETNYQLLNKQQAHSESDSFTEERYTIFSKYFPGNTNTVLDLGCNTGRGGRVLKSLNRNLHIVGLDCVEERLACLNSEIYSEKICSISTSIGVEDSIFDVVVAGEFIEHLLPSDVTKTLDEIFRILKVGGRVLLTTPNPYYIRLKFSSKRVLGASHRSQHFPDCLRTRLRMVGFSNVKIRGNGKMTRYFGHRLRYPLSLFGSYLIIGDKV
jgi:ubiquinone/menaquinone biosynthesis C-methylase UbiE